MIKDIQEKILKLKEETNVMIIAHSYQSREIVEVADYVGDSFQMSLQAKESKAKKILLCGVHFMAETAKMLAPDKRIFLANADAGCPMADQFTKEDILEMKKKDPDRKVVVYINTTARMKEACDVCVTSSTAVKIIKRMEAQKIFFVPDCNLGDYVSKQIKNKDIKLVKGGCPVHAKVNEADVMKARKAHPKALLLVHPECVPNVLKHADYIGSTSGIMEYAKKSSNKEFIIGTEISIAMHLQYENEEKLFYSLSKKITCPNMRITSLIDVYHSLLGIKKNEAYEILMTEEEIRKSRKCIDEMIRLGSD